MKSNQYFTIETDEQGIVIITMDMKDYPFNMFVTDFLKLYFETLQEELAKPEIKGSILRSARPEFMAGADINLLLNKPGDAQAFLNDLLSFHEQSLKLEEFKKPMVVLINGNCLGGGYELSLMNNHRIALAGNYQIGLPEAKLGLFPGGGGTIKLSRLFGLEKTAKIVLQGQTFRPADALKEGLVDEIVETPEELLAKGKDFILNNPQVEQPWSNPKHKIPGGGLRSPLGYMTMVGSIGNLRKNSHGNYPGLNYALQALHDSIDLPIHRALEIEARYFTKALYDDVTTNLIRTGFFGINDAKKGKAKPKGFEKKNIQKLGILGAGMMGAGIAYVSAKAGMDVVLKDVSTENAEKGKVYSANLLKGAIAKGRSTQEKADALLNKIHATEKVEDLKDCDLIIEAVFEDPTLKAVVTKESEPMVKSNGFFASNTSTLPISRLAETSVNPEKFIGIHFFSPVDKMPLVEIIVGKQTSDETLAHAIDYVTQIGKVPIVVNDSHGFFTSRVFGFYNFEAAAMVLEGINPQTIENVAKQAGMAVGPLAVMDEVSIELILKVIAQKESLNENENRLKDFFQKMADAGRLGKKTGKGFYDYPESGKKLLWKNEFVEVKKDQPISNEDIAKRLMHAMALDSYRCLEEGVLNTTLDGDIGSMLGLGFAPHTGGVFSYIDMVGIQEFVADCDRFLPNGNQWEVPQSLRDLASQNFKFYTGNTQNWTKK